MVKGMGQGCVLAVRFCLGRIKMPYSLTVKYDVRISRYLVQCWVTQLAYTLQFSFIGIGNISRTYLLSM